MTTILLIHATLSPFFGIPQQFLVGLWIVGKILILSD
jgi:hypothetical protein